ncbi:MAG: cytochrome oxidase subunit III [Acidobacteria bacterium]|nr:cytochrome oxidase subunit III [Acidobacteriota bacterium]
MGGECPFAAGWKKVMMWVFIIGDAVLFAGFLSSYGYARTMSADWPPASEVFNLGLIGLMTFVLISSSATMAAAVAMAKSDRARAARFVWMTVVGGLIFLGLQAYEWSHLIAEGGRPWANPWGASLFGAYFFMITGFHGTHVLIGVIVNIVTALRTASGVTPAENVEMAGLYWHFVDLVWVFIFTLFYLL